jgi:LysM repeat protein
MRKSLTIFVLGFLVSYSAFANRDSIGVKQINKKWFIIFKVDKGLGLYTISKSYGVSMDEIIEQNPEAANGLTPGQILYIPYSKPVRIPTETGKQNPERVPHYYTVDTAITLYRIGLRFKVSVEQIKKWNGLNSDQIQLGQKLIVGYTIGAGEDNSKPTKTELGNNSSKRTAKENTSSFTQKNNSKNKKTESREVEETVLATAVENSDEGVQNLALHKTAAAGTIIQVTNPMNGVMVYVKVVGSLTSDPQNKNLIMKISRFTADKLGIKDEYFRLNTHYSTEVIKK